MLRYIFIITLISSNCYAADFLPNSKFTPGEINPILTKEKICSSNFRTKPYRKVSLEIRKKVFSIYARQDYKGYCAGKEGCELDHLISLELGGANTVKNLWPHSYSGDWNAHIKDKLENILHKKVCSNKLTLEQAQQEISIDWITAYKKYVGNK